MLLSESSNRNLEGGEARRRAQRGALLAQRLADSFNAKAFNERDPESLLAIELPGKAHYT